MSDTLQIREATVASFDPDERTVEGLAVPYGEAYTVGGYAERFEPGAITLHGDTVQMFAQHDHQSRMLPIGKVLEGRDTPDGFLIRARLSETPKADEVYTLLRDGVLSKFSIGFLPIEYRDEDGTTVHTRADLREVSVVSFPAYKGAEVLAVRHNGDRTEEGDADMADTLEADLTEVRSNIEDLDRRIQILDERDSNDDGDQAPVFRTGGELLKALASGDESARAEFRAADTTPPATSPQAGADFSNGANWLSKPLQFVNERRRLINLFSRDRLPSAGNTVEFPKVGSTAGTVGEQAAEGDPLPYMEVELTAGSAPVATYGGYSRLTRQAIERSDEAYLSAVLRYQAIQYAKATEAAMRGALTGSAAPVLPFTGGHAAGTAEAWIGFIVDAAAAIEDNSLGLSAEFAVAGRDVFKSIATLTDSSGRPVFAIRDGGVNVVGSANLVRASANIGGLPVVVDPNLPADTMYVAASEAIATMESPGAPFRLQDEDIVTLTKDFSLYGYAAWSVNDVNGLVAADFAAVAG